MVPQEFVVKKPARETHTAKKAAKEEKTDKEKRAEERIEQQKKEQEEKEEEWTEEEGKDTITPYPHVDLDYIHPPIGATAAKQQQPKDDTQENEGDYGVDLGNYFNDKLLALPSTHVNLGLAEDTFAANRYNTYKMQQMAQNSHVPSYVAVASRPNARGLSAAFVKANGPMDDVHSVFMSSFEDISMSISATLTHLETKDQQRAEKRAMQSARDQKDKKFRPNTVPLPALKISEPKTSRVSMLQTQTLKSRR